MIRVRPLVKKVEVWNGRKIVVYRPNPKYPREKALRKLEELIDKVIARQTSS